jgi:hypothetical protein
MKPTCSMCRFFSPNSSEYGRDECRRRSPGPRLTYQGRHDEFGLGAWPFVLPQHWCGEFEPEVVSPKPADWRPWRPVPISGGVQAAAVRETTLPNATELPATSDQLKASATNAW